MWLQLICGALSLQHPGSQPAWCSPDASHPHWQATSSHSGSEVKESSPSGTISSTGLYRIRPLFSATIWHHSQSLTTRLMAFPSAGLFKHFSFLSFRYHLQCHRIIRGVFPWVIFCLSSLLSHSLSNYCFVFFMIFKGAEVILFTYVFLIFLLVF